MTIKLFIQAIIKMVCGIILMGVLLFLPAGTFSYPQAWMLMGILFVPMLFVGIVLMLKNPELLRKRLNSKEEQNEQKLVVLLSSVMFVVGFILAGFNFRYQWIILADWISWTAIILFFVSYILYAEVLRENTYLSRTVEVQENQKVVDTGLYGIVRHPMYSATILMFLAMPLILGSVISFVLSLSYLWIIAKRIKNEEEILEAELDGYKEYKNKVKYRILPFVW